MPLDSIATLIIECPHLFQEKYLRALDVQPFFPAAQRGLENIAHTLAQRSDIPPLTLDLKTFPQVDPTFEAWMDVVDETLTPNVRHALMLYASILAHHTKEATKKAKGVSMAQLVVEERAINGIMTVFNWALLVMECM